mmetsp:Transcript_15551/g.31465  ORF Transcript_15551/g.31465 Transcript_15551/m.31465 type:complete len:98 (+) Transcript_15551:86-379(+)
MSSLPPALDFAKAEAEICAKWAEEGTFKTQDKLGKERGDEVSSITLPMRRTTCSSTDMLETCGTGTGLGPSFQWSIQGYRFLRIVCVHVHHIWYTYK